MSSTSMQIDNRKVTKGKLQWDQRYFWWSHSGLHSAFTNDKHQRVLKLLHFNMHFQTC